MFHLLSTHTHTHTHNIYIYIYIERERERERVTVVKFRIDNRGSDDTGCFGIDVRTDTAQLSDMKIAGLRK